MSETEQTNLQADARAVQTPRSSSLKKELSFKSYILKISKLHNSMNKNALLQINDFCRVFCEKIANVAITQAYNNHRKTVTDEDVIVAVRLLLSPELFNAANEFAVNALTNYTGNTQQSLGKAQRSGLVFPPHLTDKFLRLQTCQGQTGISKMAVAQKAPIYMAAIVEYVFSNLLEAASKEAARQKRTTIMVRHLVLSMTNDLQLLFQELNFNWLGGGVVPNINEHMLPNKEKQRRLANNRRKARSGAETPVTPGVRKLMPGTKALRDIKVHQKSCDLLQRKEHFRRFFRAQVAHLQLDQDKLFFSPLVIDTMQTLTEQYLVAICEKAVLAMIHAQRETLEAQDLELVWACVKPGGIDRSSDAGLDDLAEPGLHRITFRAGVKRIGMSSYAVMRNIASHFVSRIMFSTLLVLNRNKTKGKGKTITPSLLRRGAALVNVNIPSCVAATASRKKKTSDESETVEPSSAE